MADSNSVLSSHRKLALIIGNNNYSRSENKLSHCITDTEDLGAVLKTINFKVRRCQDLTLVDMITTLNEFFKRIVDGDLVLFYFSGHGYQVDGKNYLIPVDDAKIITNEDVKSLAISVDHILEKLAEHNSSYVNICILDCCHKYWPKNISKTRGK